MKIKPEHIDKLATLFDMLYVFRDEEVSKYLFGHLKLKYRCTENECSCYAHTDCKHLKMRRGVYRLRGVNSLTVKQIVDETLRKLGIEPQKGKQPPACGSVELNVHSDKLIVGVKNQLVVYIK